jgi:hypothetical protein
MTFNFAPFPGPRGRRILPPMSIPNHTDTFTLTADYENRVVEALKVAQHQVRLAQATARPRMEDAGW